MFIWAALFYPVNDITTTPQAPPAFVEIAKLDANQDRDMSYSATARERQQKLYPDLAPLAVPLAAEEALARVVELAKQQPGWSVVHVDEAGFRLEATASTSVMKFIDDIVIEVRPGDDSGSEVHMRSKSRVGRSDLGANYKRITAFLAQLKSSTFLK